MLVRGLGCSGIIARSIAAFFTALGYEMGGIRKNIPCPNCGAQVTAYANPVPTVDIIIARAGRGIVLVERRFEPPGWAIPGGFVDYGECVEDAARREALEETGLLVRLEHLLGVYSDPARDKRLHTISTVFVASAQNSDQLKGGDDAAKAVFFPLNALPANLAFDHAKILDDFTHRYAGQYGLK